jgi:ATP-binding cassette subfamily C protein
MDEPTASLDALAEYHLYKSFDELIGCKTTIYISHRLSSTRFCDAIAFIEDGELKEYGTHDELMKRGGLYANMFRIQAQYYNEEEV